MLLPTIANNHGLCSFTPIISMCTCFISVITHTPRQASLCSAVRCSSAIAPLPEAVIFQSWVLFKMPAALQSADLTVGKLTTSLRVPHVPPRQAADAIKHLLHLQAEGARSARNLNPVKLYLEAQVSGDKQSPDACLCCVSRELCSICLSNPMVATGAKSLASPMTACQCPRLHVTCMTI